MRRVPSLFAYVLLGVLVGCEDSANDVFAVPAEPEAETETVEETPVEETPVSESLELSNFNPRMPIAASLPLDVEHVAVDGTRTSVVDDIVWTSSDETIASVSDGLVKGEAVGTADITATADGLTVTASLEIYAVLLSAVTFDPDPLNLDACGAADLSVSGTFADGTQFGLLPPLDFTPPTGLTVTPTATGVTVTAEDAGSYTLPFTRSSINDSLNVVAAGTLAGLELDATSVLLEIGDTVQFTATGTFSDASTADVTERGTWSLLSTTVPDSVSLPAGALGSVLAEDTGSATVRFACGGLFVDVDLVVNAGEILDQLQIDDGALELDLDSGDQQNLILTATYADGSEADVTDEAEWTVTLGDTAAISVGNTVSDKGVVTVQAGIVAETAAVVEARIGDTATLLQVFVERP